MFQQLNEKNIGILCYGDCEYSETNHSIVIIYLNRNNHGKYFWLYVLISK